MWLVSHEPRTGYQIKKEINRLTGKSPHVGVIYPLLYELEEKGLIKGIWTKKSKRRRLKYYHMTDKGKQVLVRLRNIFEMPIKNVLGDLLGETHEQK